MAQFNIDNVADGLAATLIDAVKNGWIAHTVCHAIVDDFCSHSPLADSGKRRLQRETFNQLAVHAAKLSNTHAHAKVKDTMVWRRQCL